MTQQNLLELANQGNPKAITNLLNSYLQPQGINVKASLKNGYLTIILKALEVLDKEYILSFLYEKMVDVDPQFVNKLNVYYIKSDNEKPLWFERVDLKNSPQLAPLEKTIDVFEIKPKTVKDIINNLTVGQFIGIVVLGIIIGCLYHDFVYLKAEREKTICNLNNIGKSVDADCY